MPDAAARAVRGRGCDEARALASLALDVRLDAIAWRSLRRHLDGCADCASLAAQMGATAALLRCAAPEPFTLDLAARLRPSRTGLVTQCYKGRSRRRLPWASALAAAAVALAVGSLPQSSTAPASLPAVVAAVDVPRWSAGPARLPLGQRSAGSEFAAARQPLRA